MTERDWDKKLHIQTVGRLDEHADDLHFPYEPTPYSVLERLAESGYISDKNHLVDYGCGKGRVGLYLHKRTGCTVTGIEYDRAICQAACGNLESSGADPQKVAFHCMAAEHYAVTDADCFYFFNPFSVELLRAVLDRILDSYYANMRPMRFFFYYASGDYLSALMSVDQLELCDEIDCRDLFRGEDPREKILIFEILA